MQEKVMIYGKGPHIPESVMDGNDKKNSRSYMTQITRSHTNVGRKPLFTYFTLAISSMISGYFLFENNARQTEEDLREGIIKYRRYDLFRYLSSEEERFNRARWNQIFKKYFTERNDLHSYLIDTLKNPKNNDLPAEARGPIILLCARTAEAKLLKMTPLEIAAKYDNKYQLSENETYRQQVQEDLRRNQTLIINMNGKI
jgi:hypothetical protein